MGRDCTRSWLGVASEGSAARAAAVTTRGTTARPLPADGRTGPGGLRSETVGNRPRPRPRRPCRRRSMPETTGQGRDRAAVATIRREGGRREGARPGRPWSAPHDGVEEPRTGQGGGGAPDPDNRPPDSLGTPSDAQGHRDATTAHLSGQSPGPGRNQDHRRPPTTGQHGQGGEGRPWAQLDRGQPTRVTRDRGPAEVP